MNVLVEHQALSIQKHCGTRDRRHVLLVRRITFLDRQSRVTNREAVGLCLLKVNLLAKGITEVVACEWRRAQRPTA